MRERGITEIIRTIYQHGEYKPGYNILFGPEHYKQAAKNVMSKIWDDSRNFEHSLQDVQESI